MEQQKADAIIIGAGMSGMASAIRLAMFGKKVILCERHLIPGGLNSYYHRGKRQFDVGLHALTNYVPKGQKGPLTKLMKQLRIPYDAFDLIPQRRSLIQFKSASLAFTNEFEYFRSEIAKTFSHEIENFDRLVDKIKNFNEVALNNEYLSAKLVVSQFIKEPLLKEMIFAPLMIYGSAWENDMDFSQFVIMFKALYFEGFSRPRGGVRTIINLLMKKMEELSVDVRFKTGIAAIITKDNKVVGVETDRGDIIEAHQVYSSAGYAETLNLLTDKVDYRPRIGNLSFTESIFCFDKKFETAGMRDTIIFYNDSDTYHYQAPLDLYDPRSAVICFPNNYAEDDSAEAMARVTYIANYTKWLELPRPHYLEEKCKMGIKALELIQKIAPSYDGVVLFKDIFSPTTVTRYTGHYGGAVYGSPDKTRSGASGVSGLSIIGTDQGFLGIVGAMLSGISIANLYGLSGAEA
ncbi:MAG: NAD(P)/FAD-dependent oxidoreductase [Bdellovibrio sp.]